MANLTATSSFDAVLQLETTHQAIGGAGGTMNLQAQALVNRTQYLLDQVNTKTTLAEVKTNLNVTGNAPMYACRGWIDFNGTGTPLINASGNFSSITDNGVGNYTLTFISDMPSGNFAVSEMHGNNGGQHAAYVVSRTTSSVRLQFTNDASNSYPSVDPSVALVSIIG